MKRIIEYSIIFITALFFAVTSTKVVAADSVAVENNIKAALVFKILKFIEWPVGFSSEENDFKFCTLGSDEFTESIDSIAGLENHGKNIQIVHYEQSKSLVGNCDLVLISRTKQASFHEIFKNVDGTPILTISDGDKFAKTGGMIELLLIKGRINININVFEASKVNLKISSLLLQLANIVETGGNN